MTKMQRSTKQSITQAIGGGSRGAISLPRLACTSVTSSRTATVWKTLLTRVQAPVKNVPTWRRRRWRVPPWRSYRRHGLRRAPSNEDEHFDYVKNGVVLEAVPLGASASLTSTAGLARTPPSSSQTLSRTHPLISKGIRKLIGF